MAKLKQQTILNRTEQVQEIIRCGKDPEYFVKRYAKIQHATKGIIPFSTYPFQDDCLRNFQEYRHNIVLKSRQLGLSTVTAAFAVWMAIFQKDKNILVIATKLSTAMNFIKKVVVLLNNLPPWLLMPKFEPSKQAVSFNNGSIIKAIPTSEDAGRSEALSLLIVDEAAWIRDFDNIWIGLAPTISTGGRAILLSTPNGAQGQYHKIWIDAVAEQNDFHPTKLMWWVHPEHDQDWFNNETRGLSKKLIAQEYLCDFLSSGDTFLQADSMDEVRNQICEPIKKYGTKLDIWVWNEPEQQNLYVLSADVARGDANDFSTFTIIDTCDNKVVAEYMGKIAPEKFADVIYEWAVKYNNALIATENNTFGYFVNTKLKNTYNYKYLYYSTCKGDPRLYIPTNSEELPGFSTNVKTRIQILSKLEELIRNKKIIVKSQRLYNQLQSFVWIGNKPQASNGNFDDLIMALAIGCWLTDGDRAVQASNQYEMAKAIANATSVEKRPSTNLEGLQQSYSIMNYQQRAVSQFTIRSLSGFSRFNTHVSWLLK